MRDVEKAVRHKPSRWEAQNLANNLFISAENSNEVKRLLMVKLGTNFSRISRYFPSNDLYPLRNVNTALSKGCRHAFRLELDAMQTAHCKQRDDEED